MQIICSPTFIKHRYASPELERNFGCSPVAAQSHSKAEGTHCSVSPYVAVPTCSMQCYRLRRVIFLDFLGITDFWSNIQSLQSAVVRAGLILKLNPLAQSLVHKQPELGPVPRLHTLFVSILICNSCMLPISSLFFTPEESLALLLYSFPSGRGKHN